MEMIGQDLDKAAKWSYEGKLIQKFQQKKDILKAVNNYFDLIEASLKKKDPLHTNPIVEEIEGIGVMI